MNIMDIPSPQPDLGANSEQVDDALDQQGEDQDRPKTELQLALEDYWAIKPTQECVESLVKRASDYYSYVSATGKMAMWRLCFEQYNRGFVTLGSISRGGVEGELINLPVNEFRNLISHSISITTQDKVAFEPQPVNNDYATSAQVTLAKGILQDYANNKGMTDAFQQAAVNAKIFGEGSTLKLWNENLGDLKMVDTQSQRIYKTGDVQFIELNPTNLIRDIHIQNFSDNQWFIARIFVNKYDLAVQYPDKAKAITQKSITTDWDNTCLTSNHGEDSDLIPMFLWFHKPTSAMPFGRQIFYLDGDLWLEDSHLKYRALEEVVVTNMPAPVASINFGYTTAFDLLPLQQVKDILFGAIATNNTNFAVTNILVPDECNLGVADLIGSMNLLKYRATAGKPEALNLVLTPQEVYAFNDKLTERMEVLEGINAQLRGMPDKNITSGAQSALQDMRAIRFTSSFSKSWVEFCGRLATAVLHDLQDHPEEKRTAMIAGKSNKAYMKQFYGKEVNAINRVIVTLGSAFAKTDAGKVQIAQDLMGSGMIQDPKQYIEVIETGSLEPLVEGPHRSLMLIKQENEMLSEGMMVEAAMTDDHVTHILEHANVIADPGLRSSNDPLAAQVVRNTLAHIFKHQTLLQTMPPTLAAILKLPVLGLPQPPMPTDGPSSGDGPTAPQANPPPPGGADVDTGPTKAPVPQKAPRPAKVQKDKMSVPAGMTPGNAVSIPRAQSNIPQGGIRNG